MLLFLIYGNYTGLVFSYFKWNKKTHKGAILLGNIRIKKYKEILKLLF